MTIQVYLEFFICQIKKTKKLVDWRFVISIIFGVGLFLIIFYFQSTKNMETGVGTMLNSSIMENSILSGGISDFVSYIIYFLVFLRIISIIWVFKDITARTNSLGLQVFGILLVTLLTPIVGLPLYLAIRPITYKIDKMPRREAGVLKLASCQNCNMLNDKNYNYCIQCGEILKAKCKECGHEYPHEYQYCSKCGAPNIET